MEEEDIIALVTEAQNGSREAFGELVVQFESTIFATVMKRLHNHAEAREVTQEVFMQAMQKLFQLREPERFVGWVRQIASRMAINRAMRKPHEFSCAPETFAGISSEPDTLLQDILRHEQASQLRGGLDRLREMDRDTLVAFYFEGQSLKQMSDSFDSPIGTIKRRLHTARHRLREELGDLQLV